MTARHGSELHFGQVYQLIDRLSVAEDRHMIVCPTENGDGWVTFNLDDAKPMNNWWDHERVLLDPRSYRRLDDDD